jgi:glycosyltransferase involved in cell wall biosynthesis
MSGNTVVLHLITRFLGGGAETTTKNCISALDAAGKSYDIHLGVGAEYEEDELEAVAAKNVEIKVFSTIKHYNPLAQLLAVITVAIYLHQESVDIIHLHSTEAGIIGRLSATLAGTPHIIHEIHGDPVVEDRNPVLNAFLIRIERISALITDNLIVKSRRIKQTYIDRGIGSSEQYEIIYHGVDLNRFRESEPAQVTDTDGSVVLLFVGRLVEGKGVFDLLTAFEKLKTKENVSLLVVGDGPLRAEVTTRAEEGKTAEDIHLLGYRDDIAAVMQDADVLVLPSYREGTPRVITEGLASGLPVIATDIAGIPEQVRDGENGILITPGDVSALTDAIAILVESSSRRAKMSRQARTDIERFSYKQAQTSYRDLYSRIVESESNG